MRRCSCRQAAATDRSPRGVSNSTPRRRRSARGVRSVSTWSDRIMTTAAAELPAIAGGKPIKSTPYNKLPRYGEEELAELREAIEQQTLFYASGKKVHELEKEFASLRGGRGIAA